jgi:hypothetical protein
VSARLLARKYQVQVCHSFFFFMARDGKYVDAHQVSDVSPYGNLPSPNLPLCLDKVSFELGKAQ